MTFALGAFVGIIVFNNFKERFIYYQNKTSLIDKDEFEINSFENAKRFIGI